MSTSTTATFPAADTHETTAATRSAYEPAMYLDQIHPHPKNIRHNATADEELMASILEQGLLEPLLVTPITVGDPAAGYLLIAGHRRLDGLLRAGKTTAPVIIRYDLTDTADQVAAMLVENGRRADLTPLEEAEGYGQLRFDFGWKPGAIAKAAGHTVETINKRLKLLKLDKRVQGTLQDGQLTIDDAIAIAEFPSGEQKKLANVAGGPSFRYELQRAKDRRKTQAKFEKDKASLAAAGIPEREMPKSATLWSLSDATHGMVRLGATFSTDPDDHPGCLAWVQDTTYNGPQAAYVCTNVAGHDEQLDETRRAAKLAQDQARAAEEAQKAAWGTASTLRVDAILGAFKPGIRLDPFLVGFLAAALPDLLGDLDHDRLEQYFTHAGVAEPDQWNTRHHLRKQADADKFTRHLDKVLAGTGHRILTAFVLATACRVEAEALSVSWRHATADAWARATRVDPVLGWLQLAQQGGHSPTPVDEEITALIRGSQEEVE